MRGVPAGGHKTGRARDRPRIPGSVGQVGREHFALGRSHEHIIGGGLLGKNRNLALDLRDAAVGPPRAAGVLEHPLLDDLRPEPSGRPPQRVGVELVIVVRADHEQPAAPLFPHQILRETVGEHRAGRRDVDHVGAAVLLAQPLVGRSDVEQQQPPLAAGIGRREQGIRGKVGEHEGNVLLGEIRGRGTRIVLAGESHFLKIEMLVEEFSGRIVVLDAEPGSGQAVVGGRHVEQRNGLLVPGPMQITDMEFGRIGRVRNARRGEHEARREENSDHRKHRSKLPICLPRRQFLFQSSAILRSLARED